MKKLLLILLLLISTIASASIIRESPISKIQTKEGYVMLFQGVYDQDGCSVVIIINDPSGKELIHGWTPCQGFDTMIRFAKGEKEI